MNSTAEIMERGIDCLLEHLGTVETERFISVIMRERFDYTEWHRRYFEDAHVHELNEAAVSYTRTHPFEPAKPQISLK